MKKVISSIALMFTMVFALQGQTEAPVKKQNKKPLFTTEQKATLATKKMAMALDLSPSQMQKVRPIMLQRTKRRERQIQQFMDNRKNGKRSPRNFEQLNKRMDAQLVYQRKMKSILTEGQYFRFKKIEQKKRKMVRSRMQKRQKIRRMRRQRG